MDAGSPRRTLPGGRERRYALPMATETSRRLIEAIRSIPRGRVSSYGRIAALAGLANGARAVVRLLHSSAETEKLPWHRLVRKDGSIALPEGEGRELQRALLESEGIELDPGSRVDLSRYGWP